jgi:hypothetical protein
MPKVPTYDNFQVSPNVRGGQFAPVSAPVQSGRAAGPVQSGRAAGPVQAGPGLSPALAGLPGQQLQQTGEALQRAGATALEIQTQEQLTANQAVGKKADIELTASLSNLLHHPDTGYLMTEGENAIHGHEGTAKKIQEIRQSILEGIKSSAVREMVEPIFDQRVNSALVTMNVHAGREGKKFQLQAADSRALVNLADAAHNPANEEKFNQAIRMAEKETAAIAQIKGWDFPTARLQAIKYRDAGFKMRYDAWGLSDPLSAFDHFQQNQGKISPAVRENLGRELFNKAAPVMAAEYNRAESVGGGAAAADTPDTHLPRGIRNRNPGNIMKSASQWDGEIAGNDPRYATFSTPEAGIRAMGKTLLNYQDKHGLRTVEGIVSRYAPATENNTVAYTMTVAKAVGVAPDAAIDLHDKETLLKVTKAMIRVENGPGATHITDQQIATGLAAATGGAALPKTAASTWNDPAAPTGYPLLDDLPANWKMHVLQLARSQVHQGMAEARESLRGKVQDASAAYMATGFAPNPPNVGDFVRAFGQNEGTKQYSDFQGVAALGQTLQQVKTLPTADLISMLKAAKPVPGDGFAAQQHNYETLTKAVDHIKQARASDPVSYALSAGSYGIKPLQRVNDQQELAQELPRRTAAALQMASDYGTLPQLLTKGEAKALSGVLKASSVEVQKSKLAAIYQGVGDMGLFKQTMQAVAPDNPTIAVAGIYQARGFKSNQAQDVADLILRGQAILTPNTKEDGSGHMGGKSLLPMPKEELLLSDWNSVTGDAFKGKEKASDLFMQTARAIYAARSAEEGDYSGVINSKRWASAINLATGGIEKHNGSHVVMPYGLDYAQFRDALKGHALRLSNAGAVLNTAADEMMRLPVENIGDGRYLFRRGAGYLVSKDGTPVVVDLSRGR